MIINAPKVYHETKSNLNSIKREILRAYNVSLHDKINIKKTIDFTTWIDQYVTVIRQILEGDFLETFGTMQDNPTLGLVWQFIATEHTKFMIDCLKCVDAHSVTM